MYKFSSYFLLLVFTSSPLIGQTIPPDLWKMEEIRMKHGEVLKGLIIEENTKTIVIKTVSIKSSLPFRLSTITVDKKDIDYLFKLSLKDKFVLENQIRNFLNHTKGDPKFPLENLPNPSGQKTIDTFKNMELIPLIGNTEPPRIRKITTPVGSSIGTKNDMFLIAPTTNRVYFANSKEKDYLQLRKAKLILGNEKTGNITDAVVYEDHILTGTDLGYLVEWEENGKEIKSHKILDKPIRLLTALTNGKLIVFDQFWKIHLIDLLSKKKTSFQEIDTPLYHFVETNNYLAVSHGIFSFTVWEKSTGKKLFTKTLTEPFDFLFGPTIDDKYLILAKKNSIQLFNSQTGDLIKTQPCDPDSFLCFVSTFITGEGATECLMFQNGGQRIYLNLLNGSKYMNPKSFFDPLGIIYEKEIVSEIKAYPGIYGSSGNTNLKNENGTSELVIYVLAKSAENNIIIFAKDILRKNLQRKIVLRNNIHSPELQLGIRLDLSSQYSYRTNLNTEITPITNTLFLDNKLAFCSGDKYFHLMGYFRGNFKVERGDYFHIGNASINNTGSRLAHSAHKNFCYVWDTEKNIKLGTFETGEQLETMALSGDGKIFVSCNAPGKISFWDVDSKSPITTFSLNEKPIKALLNHNGSKLLLHCQGDKAYLISKDNTERAIPNLLRTNEIETSPNQNLNHSTICFKSFVWNPIWDPNQEIHSSETFTKLNPFFNPDFLKESKKHGIRDNQDNLVSINQDASMAVSLINENTIVVWDLKNSKKLYSINQTEPVTCLKISSKGNLILSGNAKMDAFLYDGKSGNKIMSFHGDLGPVYSVGFFKDEKYACIGSKFGVNFWDLSTGVKAYTLISIGGLLFFDSNGMYDCDHHAKNFIAFRDKKTSEIFTTFLDYKNSGGTLNIYEQILKSKNNPGMFKTFFGVEDANMFFANPN